MVSILLNIFNYYSCTSRPGRGLLLEPYTNNIKGAGDKLVIASKRKIRLELGNKRIEAVVEIEKLDKETFCNHLGLVLLNESGEMITEAVPLEIVADDLKKINSRRLGKFEIRFRATREDWSVGQKPKKSITAPIWAETVKYVLLVSDLKSEITKKEPEISDSTIGNSNQENPLPTDNSSTPKSLADIVSSTEKAVFLVYAIDANGRIISQGSGFFIDPSGIGVSNHHVFEGGTYWYLRTTDGREYQVDKIIKESKETDHVVFTLKQNGIYPFLKIANHIPRKGEEIFVLGNPHGLESTVTRGIVSAIRDTLIQIDAAISPGSSGSPVMNMKGEVVGIATLKINGCENCNMAFDINVIR